MIEKMNKKAQIQMGESIFVVIIILLLIVFGIVFSSNAEKDEIIKKSNEFTELNAITLSKYATSLSELQCSFLYVTDLSCFDIYKIESFINITKEYPSLSAEYYYSQFKNANITLKEIYPSNRTWTIYYNGLGENISSRGKTTMVPVSIYDSITKKKSFGVLKIQLLLK
jgi:hypothetical protein